jgi:uncharacterized surface protein with fasciclin (FAS1) repeats
MKRIHMISWIVTALSLLAFGTLPIRSARADDLMTVAAKTPGLSMLVKLIQAADLTKTLQDRGPYTLLAPNDDAFAKLPKEQMDDLLKPENTPKLRSLLLYHVIGAKFLSVDLAGMSPGSKGPSLSGATLTLTWSNPPIFNGAAKVVKADILADNGVIHIVDTVLMPPVPRVAAAAIGTKGDTMIGKETITALAAKTKELSVLYDLLKTTGLDETLEKRGPLTVFAPTNDAFNKIGGSIMVERLKDPRNRAQLLSILTYHLVPGRYAAADLKGLDGATLPTTDRGTSLAVSAKEGARVNAARVVKADIAAKNGIIHLIDAVLVPPKYPAEPTK